MPTKEKKPPSTQLYPQDIVQCTNSPALFGVIEKCWWDGYDDLADSPEAQAFHNPFAPPPTRPLKEGEFSVSFYAERTQCEIKTASDLRVVDRTMRTGDICKRAGSDDPQSGVVVDARVKSRLAHAISGKEIPGWKTQADYELTPQPENGEFVTYDDWIGQVVEVYDEVLVEDSTNNQLVKINELGTGMYIGERGPDLMPTAPLSSLVNNVMSAMFGGPRTMDTVLGVVHTVYAIAWLAINQSLDPAEATKRQRPKRLWAGKELQNLVMMPVPSDLEATVGTRVSLKDEAGVLVTQHGSDQGDYGVYKVNAYKVVETETEVDVIWQNGRQETLLARDVVPQMSQDEYECWPGEYALWKADGEAKNVVVQSVNAADRTAKVLLIDSGVTELVSVLELDRSASDPFLGAYTHVAETLGVNRGDVVLIHRPGTTNGCDKSRVPRIGELESWLREDVEAGLNHNPPWKREMSELGAEVARSRSTWNADDLRFKRASPGDEKYLWFGEVVMLNLDGTAVVKHVEGTVRTYSVEQLTILVDGVEALHEELAMNQDGPHADSDEAPGLWVKEDGHWRAVRDEEDEGGWEDEEEDETMDVDDHFDGNGAADLDAMDVDLDDEYATLDTKPSIASPSSPSQDSVWSELAEGARVTNNVPTDGTSNVTHMIYSPSSTTPPSPRRSTVQLPASNGASAGSSLSKEYVFKDQMTNHASTSNGTALNGTSKAEDEELSWKRFDILPSAPVDHAFYSQPPAQPGKAFMVRLQREYRALANSLPDTIVVRAFEDRSDLLRCLIIGPENTPYEDAPFVIDWRLESNFPNAPPVAHFLSWTNGNGRVNPNLYEEGKVCLSLLGTWQGDRNETWSPARSSLLQAFVSIQGLILVKEPWYCEPGYEKLRGTEEGATNSRLYSEKAYVLSRGFVRRALEIPLGGFEEEIKSFYFTHGRLRKILEDSRALIENSRKDPNPSNEQVEKDGTADLAIPRLTTGGIIMLERTLNKLQSFLDEHESRN
ncbi:hypothetical protein NP233_g2277 [Leucocoprinus birnbaumii]|uniref:UBC core domain-containing protein n=1 Tax=Leucocoprinus birnbaumii TaxID=56174 RepID=A0AAD5W2J7_9AGAR|nr:hypothetical protein NP233_g2277 [Leucocoprinus birnbaumii]